MYESDAYCSWSQKASSTGYSILMFKLCNPSHYVSVIPIRSYLYNCMGPAISEIGTLSYMKVGSACTVKSLAQVFFLSGNF